jgi:methionine--tRNA ligase beta chain
MSSLRKCLALACTLSTGSALTMRPMVRSGLPVGRPLRMMCAEAAPAEPAPAAKKEPAAVAEEVPPFALLDVRVGKIVEAWVHPDSDKLWCERIDVGEEEPREIASGLRAYYPTADLLEGRSVLVVCNLKEAKLAGFKSNGMVLCASNEDKSDVKFVDPPADSQPGERVVCEGMVAEPATSNQMKKKKLMDKAATELRAVDGVACYRNVPLGTAAGQCTTPVTAGTIN